MDPITITVSVLSVITLANNVYNTFSRLSKSTTSNNRIKIQRISFKTEIVTLEQWIKNCSMSGTPLKGISDVTDLLDEFRKQAKNVEKLLQTYTFSSDGDAPTTKKFASRVKYESGGYEELNEMIVLLEKLNKALQTIAPPLPPGYDFVANNRNTHLEGPQRDQEISLGYSIRGSIADLSAMSIDAEDADDHNRQDSVESLWNASCVAFVTIAEYAGPLCNAVEECRERFSLWGIGLFGSSELHLDSVLRASPLVEERLAGPLASRFVEIALEQVHFIDHLLDSDVDRDQARLKDASAQLKTRLILTDIAQPILEDLLYGSLIKANSGGGKSSSEETAEARMKHLRNLVELLFGYLPIINRLRRSRTLAEEKKDKMQAVSATALTSTKSFVSAASASTTQRPQDRKAQDDVDSLIARNIETAQNLEQILREVETRQNAESRGIINHTYSSLLAKEWQRMEDWSQGRGLQPVKTRTQHEIMKVQDELNVKLQDLVRKVPEAAKVPAAARSEKQALMTEEQIKDAVQCFNSATTHLYAATS